MIAIAGYGAVTAAGAGVEALWTSVETGCDFRPARWPIERASSSRQTLLTNLLRAYQEASTGLTANGQPVGVILCSTKGFVEDVVWHEDADLSQDLIAPLLGDFLKASELRAVHSTCLSNACSSALSAVFLASHWLKSGRLERVVILAVDEVGPFVEKGFHALHALTGGRCRPFAADRDGLKLGEAAACLILDSRQGLFALAGVGVNAEGYAVTRPSPSGESLARCLPSGQPDLILAHGTGTLLNDQVEDQVFFAHYGRKPWVTASKWSVGHTLAASGAVDLILACEAIRRGRAFAMANTPAVAEEFRCRYLTAGSKMDCAPERVLVSSLGFGGIHAAALVERRSA